MTIVQRPNQIDQLVINWHVNEACNYRCGYCYAKWTGSGNRDDVARDQLATDRLLTELRACFDPENPTCSLRNDLRWSSLRLNIAGGEPLLYTKEVAHIIKTGRRLGFDMSVITNGSRLTNSLLNQIAPDLGWLGISIDAAHDADNAAIGRADRAGRMLALPALEAALNEARATHPGLKLKINTVVNALNWRADLAPVLDRLRPEKWKVLRMLPAVTSDLAVTDQQFAAFVDRHDRFADVWAIENNADMITSYIMIDPKGRFFQNQPGRQSAGYIYSGPILQSGAELAFDRMAFSPALFAARYV